MRRAGDSGRPLEAISSPLSVRWSRPAGGGVAAGRRRRDELWGAEREGSLGSAAIVFAVGFAVATVGMILLAWHAGPSSRNEAEQWLEVIAELLLALAAACGAIGFFVSRREVRAAPRS